MRSSSVVTIEEMVLDERTVSQYVVAHEYNEDGTVQELDCEVTLNKVIYKDGISALNSDSEGTSTLYVLSGTLKESTDQNTEDGVTLYGCIGWTDNLGPWNRFEYCKGSRSGSYDPNEKGTYTVQRESHSLCSGRFDTSFYDTSDEPDPSGYKFRMRVSSKTASGTYVDINWSIGLKFKLRCL